MNARELFRLMPIDRLLRWSFKAEFKKLCWEDDGVIRARLLRWRKIREFMNWGKTLLRKLRHWENKDQHIHGCTLTNKDDSRGEDISLYHYDNGQWRIWLYGKWRGSDNCFTSFFHAHLDNRMEVKTIEFNNFGGGVIYIPLENVINQCDLNDPCYQVRKPSPFEFLAEEKTVEYWLDLFSGKCEPIRQLKGFENIPTLFGKVVANKRRKIE